MCHVPRAMIVMVNAWAIHRDPKHWDDAKRFKPERFETISEGDGEVNKLMPFGVGRRACPGEGLGLALGSLIHCFEWERSDLWDQSHLSLFSQPREGFGESNRWDGAVFAVKSSCFFHLNKPHNRFSLPPRTPSQLRASSIKRFSPMAALTTIPTVGLSKTFTRLREQGKVPFIPYIAAGDPDLCRPRRKH
ncbi:hypothetical protein TIFTF001_004715 [Ficus carica]|uniref:Cytochrome P450 n=1 Tax=Ficus carica TaxID=3494 RepID=A0AA87ZCM7_FICCA|nr:hypothetical protein TIFTF001_004715 [Ficus carica]